MGDYWSQVVMLTHALDLWIILMFASNLLKFITEHMLLGIICCTYYASLGTLTCIEAFVPSIIRIRNRDLCGVHSFGNYYSAVTTSL